MGKTARRNVRFTAAQDELIVRLKESGRTTVEIAAAAGKTYMQVYRRLRYLKKLPILYGHVPDEIRQEIFDTYCRGLNQYECAALFGVDQKTVSNVVREIDPSKVRKRCEYTFLIPPRKYKRAGIDIEFDDVTPQQVRTELE